MSVLRTGALVLGALLVQVGLLSQFAVSSARPDLIILVVVAAAFVHGPGEGAVVGFLAGLALDVFLSTPFGFSALTLTLAGYGVGTWSERIVRSSWWLSCAVLGVSSALIVVGQAVVGDLLGMDTLSGRPVLRIVLVVTVVNMFLAPLATRLVRWAGAGDHPRRRHSFAR